MYLTFGKQILQVEHKLVKKSQLVGIWPVG